MRLQSAAISAAVTTITRTITVTAGMFAPGHLGELTWQVPFELADAVLEETRAREQRLRGYLAARYGVGVLIVWCRIGARATPTRGASRRDT